MKLDSNSHKKCRHCGAILQYEFIDLYHQAPSNSYLKKQDLDAAETLFPLKVYVCERCLLVQVPEYKHHSEIFNSEYAYFSSYSKAWLEHAKNYVDSITEKLKLDSKSLVIEIASNDGYLLQYFKLKKIPCLGIEPTHSTAKVAKAKGIEVIESFFSYELSKSLSKADLILGNNVLAHVPDINDFIKGVKYTLKPLASATFEFPHLLNLIRFNQFDTIYHEHFSYLSLVSLLNIFKSQGLKIYDVEELTTHGGSLRIYVAHIENNIKISKNVEKILQKEKNYNLDSINGYIDFAKKCEKIKLDLLTFLLKLKRKKKKIIAYGAAAKGNTLLNFCGIKPDLLPLIIDISPYKQNKFAPQSHIPIVSEDFLKEIKPQFILILAWNLSKEIITQLAYTSAWSAEFVIAIPHLIIGKEKILKLANTNGGGG
ncbi:class I SAM-dependent methyltransferase, partial [Helicobacter saguini]